MSERDDPGRRRCRHCLKMRVLFAYTIRREGLPDVEVLLCNACAKRMTQNHAAS